MNEITFIKTYLRQVTNRAKETKVENRVVELLKEMKADAVDADKQEQAKQIWCYEQILKIQNKYIQAFDEIKNGDFYSAWCLLERVEIGVLGLEKHLDLETNNDEYKLAYIKEHTEKFQSLFPYKFFVSPGMLYLEIECSICKQPISLRNFCGHVVGEIYSGEMCCRVITKWRLLEISVVTNPVQKYSVLFTSDPKTKKQVDHYNYSTVNYVIRGLRQPFEAWDVNWTKKRHPHAKYRHISRNEDCPCESGKKYKKCCFRESGILRPHAEIRFSKHPPADLPVLEYTY